MNKKIKAILNENLLFAFRENLIIVPTLTYLIFMWIYLLFWTSVILNDFKEISFISLMSNIQYFLGISIIIFLSISSFDKDFKSKNIYIILQQVTKREYFLWKIFSIILISILLNILLLIIFYIGYIIEFKTINLNLSYIFLYQELDFIMVAFITSILTLMFQKNMTRLILLFIILLLWHSIPLLKVLLNKWIIVLDWLGKFIIDTLYYIIPNLDRLNVKNTILYKTSLLSDFWFSMIYTLVFTYLIYNISLFIFKKKDF